MYFRESMKRRSRDDRRSSISYKYTVVGWGEEEGARVFNCMVNRIFEIENEDWFPLFGDVQSLLRPADFSICLDEQIIQSMLSSIGI